MTCVTQVLTNEEVMEITYMKYNKERMDICTCTTEFNVNKIRLLKCALI